MTKKKVGFIANLCIAVTLIGLGIAVFTADLNNLFISVSAPVKNGDRASGNISLMFVVDEGTNLTELDKILATLKNKSAPATFFIGGKWAENNRDYVKKIAKDFEIGNHAYSNRNMTKMNEAQQFKEIDDTHKIVQSITSAVHVTSSGGETVVEESAPVDMNLFLPPNADFNKTTLKCAEKLGYRTVIWSRTALGDGILDKATRGVAGGDFVLLLPTTGTALVMHNILNEYAAKRLAIVNISSNI